MHILYAQADTLSREVIGAAIEVHRVMGPGLIESVYEKCLQRELELRGLHVYAGTQVFDANAFVRILADCDNRDLRQTFAVALVTKLRNLGVLDQ